MVDILVIRWGSTYTELMVRRSRWRARQWNPDDRSPTVSFKETWLRSLKVNHSSPSWAWARLSWVYLSLDMPTLLTN